MKAMILAGGYGTRLSEETDRIPKPMIEIDGKPILWHIMKIYAKHGITDFVVCLGYKGYLIKEYFLNYASNLSDMTVDLSNGKIDFHHRYSDPWRVTLADTGVNAQTGGRMARAKEYIGSETFCMTYGDGVADVDVGKLLAFHESHDKYATVTAVPPPGRFGALKINNDEVDRFAEKVDNVDARINGGFFVLEPEIFDYIMGADSSWEKQPMEQLAAEGQLMAYQHDGFWQPMDTLRDKRYLEGLCSLGQAPWLK